MMRSLAWCGVNKVTSSVVNPARVSASSVQRIMAEVANLNTAWPAMRI